MEMNTGILRRRSADWPVLDAVGSHTLKAIVAARAFITERSAWSGALYGKVGNHPQHSNRSILGRSLQGQRHHTVHGDCQTSRASSNEEKHRAALSKAKALAKALDTAIDDT